MQITGTISQIVPTPDHGYQPSQGDYVFTHGMTVTAPDGQIYTGEIGSKTEIYPVAVGQQITVIISQSAHGPKFKKINPQYAGQQPAPVAQGPTPQQSRPAPAINSAPPQRIPSEWDKPVDWHDNKQLLIVRQSSLSNAIALAKISDMEHPTIDNILSTAEKLAYFVYHGIQDELDKTLAQGGQPNPDWVGDDPSAPGDKF